MFEARIAENAWLRPLAEADAAELFALVDAHREDLRRWLPWVDTTLVRDDTRRFLRVAVDQQDSGHGFHAGLRVDDRLAGIVGFHRIDWINRAVELGYWLAPTARGRGLMTGCCRAMVDHAMGRLGLNRIVIRCAEDNLKSRAIPERLGFTREGVQRQAEMLNGKYHDLVICSLLADEWKAARLQATPDA